MPIPDCGGFSPNTSTTEQTDRAAVGMGMPMKMLDGKACASLNTLKRARRISPALKKTKLTMLPIWE